MRAGILRQALQSPPARGELEIGKFIQPDLEHLAHSTIDSLGYLVGEVGSMEGRVGMPAVTCNKPPPPAPLASGVPGRDGGSAGPGPGPKSVACLADRVLPPSPEYEEFSDLANLSLADLCRALSLPTTDVEYLWSESPCPPWPEPVIAPAVKERSSERQAEDETAKVEKDAKKAQSRAAAQATTLPVRRMPPRKCRVQRAYG